MGHNWSVICCLFNSFPVARKTIDALSETCPPGTEVIFVNNRGPDWPIIESYIEEIKEKAFSDKGISCRYFLAERNLGCHGGWNFGYKRSNAPYVVKIDDDTVPLVTDWPLGMQSALDDIDELGFVAGNVNESAKQNIGNLQEVVVNGHPLQVAESGIVGFSCVMFRRTDIEKWGLMAVAGSVYPTGGVDKRAGESLYGGEEGYYLGLMRPERTYVAYYVPARFHHADNKERDYDYVFWKRVYGFYGWTTLDLVDWRDSPDRLEHYHRAIITESASSQRNDVLLLEWSTRVGEIGDSRSIDILEAVIGDTHNGAVKEAAEEAIKKIKQRGVA